MRDRLSRKQIKQDIREDEVQSFLASTVLRIQENPTLYIGAVVGLIGLVLASTGVFAFLDSRADTANAELGDAIRVYDTPVDPDAAPATGDDPVFTTEEERLAETRKALGAVNGGAASEIANLYLAELALESENDVEAASQAWGNYLESNSGNLMAMWVRINQIQLERQTGDQAALAESLRLELERADRDLPEDVLLFELARTYDALGQTDDAIERYQQILDEYPSSPFVADARRATTSA